MRKLLPLILFIILPTVCHAQNPWTGIIAPTRAIDWTPAFWTIPTYTVPCSSQPSFGTGSGNAGANTTSYNTAIASCDATHNVVNMPAGMYYMNGGTFAKKSKAVVRGAIYANQAGSIAVSTTAVTGTGTSFAANFAGVTFTCTSGACNGQFTSIASVTDGTHLTLSSAFTTCMSGCTYSVETYIKLVSAGLGCLGVASVPFCMGGDSTYFGTADVLPPNGTQQCLWTAGYSQGTSSITLNTCGSGAVLPPVGGLLVLDQGDDATDSGGIYVCGALSNNGGTSCNHNGSGGNADGRVFGGNQYSEQQIVKVTSISGSGTGPYTVGVTPSVYFNNIRVGQNPGAWWGNTPPATLEGMEYMTIDQTGDTSDTYTTYMLWCNQCWYRGIRSITGGNVDHFFAGSCYQCVVRDNYIYGFQHGGSSGYALQAEEISNSLFMNNIIQNTISPNIYDAVTGVVTAYNFTPYVNFNGYPVNPESSYLQGIYASHNSGSEMNLNEGNMTTAFFADIIWGTSDLITVFRNQAMGWQLQQSVPIVHQAVAIGLNAGNRAVNVIGNILGNSTWATQYQAYATSTTVVSGAASYNNSIYGLGATDTGGDGVCTTPPNFGCDPLVFSTLMRWGNYDTVNTAIRWDNTESSPGAVMYVGAQSTPASQALPNSLFLTANTTATGCGSGLDFWKNPTDGHCAPFPPIGPDITGGNVGQCVGGTYAGMWALSSAQCTGGSLGAAWGGHVNANPAMYNYFKMGGVPDGTGAVLSFNPLVAYASDPPVASGPFGVGTGILP